MSRRLGFLALLLLQACSPVYEYRAAVGHIKFLAHRRSIEKAAGDPRTPPELKARLRLTLDIRRFGFDTMGLRRSKEYSTYSPVSGPALTWLVSGSKKTSFTPYQWKFFLVGTFPYEGHWKKEQAIGQERRLEKLGYDACVRGAAAYNTPLWISDPLPSTLLDYQDGDLAEVLLHELTHSTVYFGGRSDFDEAVATFVGQEGAKDFLASRYGPGSKQSAAYLEGLAKDREFNAELDSLYGRLNAVYSSSATDEEKLREREPIFEEGKRALEKLGHPLPKLNNAVILSFRLYNANLDLFGQAFEKCGRNWPRFIALLKSLDHRDPLAALTAQVSGAACRQQELTALADCQQERGDAPGLERALARLEAIASPSDDELLARVRAQSFLERYEAAEGTARELLRRAPRSVPARMQLAVVYGLTGRLEEAVTVLKDVLRDAPGQVAAEQMLASTLSRLGRHEEAAAHFARAKELGSLDAYIAQGYADLAGGRDAEGRADFEALVAVDSAAADGLHHMGVYEFLHGRYGRAEDSFRRALERQERGGADGPDSLPHTAWWLGRALEAQGKNGQAEELYHAWLARTRESSEYHGRLLDSLARLRAAAGDRSGALALYGRAADDCAKIAGCPRAVLAEALADEAGLLLDSGRKEQAARDAERAWQLAGCRPLLYELPDLLPLARVLARLGDADRAESLYRRMVDGPLPPRADPRLSAQAARELADLLARQGRSKEAARLYEQALPIMRQFGP